MLRCLGLHTILVCHGTTPVSSPVAFSGLSVASPVCTLILWHVCMLMFLTDVYGVQTPAEGSDANIQNSYLVNKSADGSGDGSLSVLGQVYANFPC